MKPIEVTDLRCGVYYGYIYQTETHYEFGILRIEDIMRDLDQSGKLEFLLYGGICISDNILSVNRIATPSTLDTSISIFEIINAKFYILSEDELIYHIYPEMM